MLYHPPRSDSAFPTATGPPVCWCCKPSTAPSTTSPRSCYTPTGTARLAVKLTPVFPLMSCVRWWTSANSTPSADTTSLARLALIVLCVQALRVSSWDSNPVRGRTGPSAGDGSCLGTSGNWRERKQHGDQRRCPVAARRFAECGDVVRLTGAANGPWNAHRYWGVLRGGACLHGQHPIVGCE